MRSQQSEDALPNIRVRLLLKLIFRYEVTESNGRSNLLRLESACSCFQPLPYLLRYCLSPCQHTKAGLCVRPSECIRSYAANKIQPHFFHGALALAYAVIIWLIRLNHSENSVSLQSHSTLWKPRCLMRPNGRPTPLV
jgi:hypothetical protein